MAKAKPETVTIEIVKPYKGRPVGTRKDVTPERAKPLVAAGVAVIVSDGNPED